MALPPEKKRSIRVLGLGLGRASMACGGLVLLGTAGAFVLLPWRPQSGESAAERGVRASAGPLTSGATAIFGAAPPRSKPGPDACIQRWVALGEIPALAGAARFEARRAELLGRAKGEPVVFLRAPERAPNDTNPRLAQLRILLAAKPPALAIPEISRALRHHPEDARALFLSEGYVYSDDPETATTLVDGLTLGRLFGEPSIHLARGANIYRLLRDRKAGTYRYADGDDAGEEAHVLLGDRLSVLRDGLFPLLHRDLGELMASSSADRVEVDRLVTGGAKLRLFFGETSLRAVADDDGTSLRLACVEASEGPVSSAVRADNRSRRTSLSSVRRAVRDMMRERLRFDEPLEEEGQQDGSLRPLWRWSYDHGGHGYRFNDIPYQVFDGAGRPYPPQVCVDFVLDAYERGSGTWFGGTADPRKRTQGSIDFDLLGVVNRRSAQSLVEFASSRADLFEVWNLTSEERVPYGRRGEFFRTLVERRGAYKTGDIVVIHGVKADGKTHYHSFLVDQTDPISGIPIRFAGNAGRPRLQTWEGVMRSAPQRSVRQVISPRTDWLAKTLGRSVEVVAAAAP